MSWRGWGNYDSGWGELSPLLGQHEEEIRKCDYNTPRSVWALSWKSREKFQKLSSSGTLHCSPMSHLVLPKRAFPFFSECFSIHCLQALLKCSVFETQLRPYIQKMAVDLNRHPWQWFSPLWAVDSHSFSWAQRVQFMPQVELHQEQVLLSRCRSVWAGVRSWLLPKVTTVGKKCQPQRGAHEV